LHNYHSPSQIVVLSQASLTPGPDATYTVYRAGKEIFDGFISSWDRDENNESQTMSFDETWQREDDQSLESRQDYFIGENVDLINVRVKKPKCGCTEIADEVSNPYEPTP